MGPGQQLDIGRRVYGVMGLPFDAVTTQQAVDAVIEAVRTRCRLLVSTPNLNFVVAARHDAALRRTVLASDLSLADGMPVVWVARLLGVPITERVSGAGLFEALQCTPCRPPIRVFFFGGRDGVAGEASDRVNRAGGGLSSVGFMSPGFGSIDDLSTPQIIGQINAAEPDFLVVALGAAKGQSWIERNLPRLSSPVVSHLGAVVNFAAGRVIRAPVWAQRIGAEWAWRIKEEPALARRYTSDAWAFGGLLLREVLPCALFARQSARFDDFVWAGTPNTGGSPPMVRLIPVHGRDNSSGQLNLRALLQQAARNGQPLVASLDELPRIDPQAAGRVMQLIGAASAHGVTLRLVSTRPGTVTRVQRWSAIPEVELSTPAAGTMPAAPTSQCSD